MGRRYKGKDVWLARKKEWRDARAKHRSKQGIGLGEVGQAIQRTAA